ncbi:MAG TPA: hypothetical protein VFI31_04710 [Pirellulales bacterium]|nr:hypothetical protein [Pirellulales bacterium]
MDQQATTESFPIAFPRRWLPRVYFDEIEGVYFAYTQVTDARLAYLRGLTNLEWVNLDDTLITDAGLAHLQGLTNLKGSFSTALRSRTLGWPTCMD